MMRKPDIQILEPKMVQVNTIYSLTVNIKAPNKWDKQMPSFIERLKYNKAKLAQFLIFGEVLLYLDLARTGRIHWHGTIRFRSNRQIGLFYAIMPRLLHAMNIELDTIADPKIWDDYILKLRHITEPLCKKLRMTDSYCSDVLLSEAEELEPECSSSDHNTAE